MNTASGKIWIIGAGGFASELLFSLRGFENEEDRRQIAFATEEPPMSEFMGRPVFDLSAVENGDCFAIAIGAGQARERLHKQLRDRGAVPLAAHAPTALVGHDVCIGEGSVLSDHAMLTGNAAIGVQFQCNIYSYVAHDCMIGDYVTFAPKVCCNGNVHIGDHAYIGTAAILKQGTPDKPLKIGNYATIGMGAVVTKDVPPGAVVVGNPAYILRQEKIGSPVTVETNLNSRN